MRTLRPIVALSLMVLLLNVSLLPLHAQEPAAEANKALVNRYGEELINQRKLDISSELFSPDAIFHQPAGPDLTLDQQMASYQDMFAAFPDLRVSSPYARIAEGDYVVTAFAWEGTSAQGGQKVQFNVINLCRIQDSRIVEVWHMYDSMNMAQQSGMVPTQGELPAFVPWEMTLGSSSTSPQENKAIVDLNFRTWPRTLDVATVAMDMTVHLPVTFGPDPQPDFGGNALWAKQYQTYYPEFALTGPGGEGDYLMVAEGDLVAVLYGLQFHFTQDLPGMPANGANVKALGLSIVRIENGQEAEFWVNVDTGSIISQLTTPPAN